MNPVFLISSILALVGAVMMVTRRNPVYSAVWLLVTFLSVAVIFLLLSAPFLAAIHVLVYTGAILVLFLFVIMLLNLRESELGEEHPITTKIGVGLMAGVLFVVLAQAVLADPSLAVPAEPSVPDLGSVESVGLLLFRTYGLAFELVSVLIVVAMFGAMVLAKKRSSRLPPPPAAAAAAAPPPEHH